MGKDSKLILFGAALALALSAGAAKAVEGWDPGPEYMPDTAPWNVAPLVKARTDMDEQRRGITARQIIPATSNNFAILNSRRSLVMNSPRSSGSMSGTSSGTTSDTTSDMTTSPSSYDSRSSSSDTTTSHGVDPNGIDNNTSFTHPDTKSGINYDNTRSYDDSTVSHSTTSDQDARMYKKNKKVSKKKAVKDDSAAPAPTDTSTGAGSTGTTGQ
jgi:hypothetical protein